MKILKNFKSTTLAKHQAFIYSAYITLACVFTAELNVIHTHFVLGDEIVMISFITPMLAGTLFGCLLARIQLLSDQLQKLAYTDNLTGIFNRLHLDRLLESEIEKVKRYGGELSIIFFDIDHFKRINDTHGHPVGDEVLKELAKVVTKTNRSTDIFARYGGEEFIILTPSTNIDGAVEHANRLKQNIEQHAFSIGRVTVSFGVTELRPSLDTQQTLIERVDQALYQAKSDGRNCVRQL